MSAAVDDLASLRTELHAMLYDRSFKFGDFVLRSGRRSDFYFDGKQVTLDGRGLYLVSRLILQRCRELPGITAVGGMTLGADPIAAGVAALSGMEDDSPLQAFIVRKEVKDHGTGKPIEGPALQPGQRVVMVEDTITTGGAILQAYDRVVETGADVVEAIVIVDREEGGREALADRGIPLHALYRRSEFPTRLQPA
ncbi:MAG TPA: orotate phosphoribosyltransferase [Candidatus Dormibacteraeota bacterium]|jgi:orotate phosphoribosyltransferase|nr:orotate phosphoribosyltransferase [Candidatus Dormibacteraeota bacterium]